MGGRCISDRAITPPRRAALAVLAAFLLLAFSLAVFWPGFAMYDTVAQYEQAVGGVYDDWHPPAMARLWSVLAAVWPGAGPMLAVQMGLYWLGLGGVAAGLAATGRRRGAVAALAIGLLPPFLGWQAVVLKDSQATGALLAAAGLAGWWRLRGRAVPVAATVAIALLLGFATLVRANTVFAAAPLAALLLPMGTRPGVRVGMWVAITGLALALAPIVNHRLFGAIATGVERTAPLYDLAGIAARTPDAETGLTAPERALIVRRHCARPFFWDPLGDAGHCGAIMDRLQTVPVATVNRWWIAAVLRHPLAYAAHRLGHLNSTDRWLIPPHWLSADPAQTTEKNDLGLGMPGRAAVAWQRLAAVVVETPLGWPIAWIVLAAIALAAAIPRPAAPPRDLAIALLGSALALEASFAVLSIASDLRYHLWSMIATAIGVILLADGTRLPPRLALIGGTVLVLVIGVGIVARLTLPPAPLGYAAMLG